MKLICFDCKKILKKNAEYVEYPVNVSANPKKRFVKCKECHKKDHWLRNFMETEVYSRVVGYIRPVSQWNKGKREEFKDRKVFKPKK